MRGLAALHGHDPFLGERERGTEHHPNLSRRHTVDDELPVVSGANVGDPILVPPVPVVSLLHGDPAPPASGKGHSIRAEALPRDPTAGIERDLDVVDLLYVLELEIERSTDTVPVIEWQG